PALAVPAPLAGVDGCRPGRPGRLERAPGRAGGGPDAWAGELARRSPPAARGRGPRPPPPGAPPAPAVRGEPLRRPRPVAPGSPAQGARPARRRRPRPLATPW